MSKKETQPRVVIRQALELGRRKSSPAAESAPSLSGLGEKVLALARQKGLVLEENPETVEILADLELDQEVSAEVMVVVGEILAFAFKANRAWREREPG